MATSKVIRMWIEMSQTFVEKVPPQREDFQACIFINRCELRENNSGVRCITRYPHREYVCASTRAQMEAKVVNFAMREDVRVLAIGINMQGCEHDIDPAEDVVEGIAAIYQIGRIEDGNEASDRAAQTG